MRTALALMQPALGQVSRAALETSLDAAEMNRVRRSFEGLVRDGTRASGPGRIAIEKVSIVLRVLEMRVRAIARASTPAQVAGHRASLMADLWYEPLVARASPEGEFDWRALPAELHREWLEQLARDWRRLNWYYLEESLREPIFELLGSREQLGRWTAASRTIGIGGWHIANHAWHEVVETLKHEMAHQMVSELFQQPDAAHHSTAFRAACEKLRCLSNATADPGRMVGLEESTTPTDRLLAKIHRLLRLGTSPNQHEAALAMERASALLTKYNLDLGAAQETRTYSRRWLGPSLSRRQEHHTTLALVLTEHFFVRLIWVPAYDALSSTDGVQMLAIGTKPNLDIAEYVHDFLSRTIEQLWEQHRESESYRGGRKPQYLAGLTRGFLDKLDSQRQRLNEERALIWKGDAGLRDHVKHLFPRLSTTRSGGVSRSDDYHAGIDHGRKITLRMGVTERAKGRGGLLPPGSAQGEH